MKEHILFKVQLESHHNQKASSRRIISGREYNKRPYQLKIVRFDDDQEVYLIEYDRNNNEIIDTFHDSVSKAMKHAQFDWGIQISDWHDCTTKKLS